MNEPTKERRRRNDERLIALLNSVEDLKEDVKEIKEQTIKTNGRVGALESWKFVTIGGLSVVTVLVIPILLKILFP